MTTIKLFERHSFLLTDAGEFLLACSYNGRGQVTGVRWEQRRDGTGPIAYRGIDRAELERVTAVPVAILDALEHAVRGANATACAAEAARIQAGRVEWARMTPAEREAMNAYAQAVEGHTID